MKLKEKYFIPEVEVIEMNTRGCLLEASGLGLGENNGGKDAESRLDGGDWGDGSWY